MITLCGIYDGLNTKQGRLRSLNAGFAQLDGALCRHFCPELVAWLSQLSLTDIPSDAYLHHLNQFIMRLKSENIWQQLDRLWIFATEYRSNARVSLVNPNGLNAAWPTNITEVSSPSWVALQGYTGNGSSSYLNTNYNQATSNNNFTLNSGSMGTYILSPNSMGLSTIGAYDGTQFNSIFPWYTADSLFVTSMNGNGNNGTSYVNVNYGYAPGMSAAAAISSTKNAAIRNDVISVGSITRTSIPNYNLFICATNQGGSPVYLSTYRVAMAFSGSGTIDQTALYRIHQSFAEKIGYNV